MDVHHYHPETGEYLATSEADPDPLSDGEHLIPAHATALAPPAAGENEVAVFDGAEWALKADHRGVRYWTPDGTPLVIARIGEKPPADALLTAPEPPELSASERAAGVTLTAVQLFDALAAEPLLDRKALQLDVKAWLRAQITASALSDPQKRAALTRLDAATAYPRRDPDQPGLLDAVASVLPRTDGKPGGLAAAEIDALFLRAGAAELAPPEEDQP